MYMYQMEEINDGFEDEVMAYRHITRLFPSGWLGLWYHVVVPSTQTRAYQRISRSSMT